ncbi:putative hydrolase or acyltransferase of alpha/beta superfamily [Phyllobacterium sp. YR531]|nr:putative hydrolase or acyltransferase of alpha/beta superfamily [Phyllobacterium sp. YR531]
MIWWETDLCRMIADGGRFVIRYDNRDTGLSTSYPTGNPGYALSDMASDAIRILDWLEVRSAHIVGRSLGAAIALAIAIDHPKRALSITFVSATTGDDDLPAMTSEFEEATSKIPDFSNLAALENHIVEVLRIFSGNSPHFDEVEMRSLSALDIARTRNMQSTLANHFLIDFDAPRNGELSDLSIPALIVHGENDPVFPLPHGRALSDAVPGSRLLVLPDTGHDIPRQHWEIFVTALTDHTKI